MNKKAIWIIIGLMSAALIGIVLLQMYWIRWSIQLNEQHFETNVFSAISRVSEILQVVEEDKDKLAVMSYAAPSESMQQQLYQLIQRNSNVGVSVEASYYQGVILDSLVKSSLEAHLNSEQCNCSECQRERLIRFEQQEKYMQKRWFDRLISPQPLADRIDIRYMDGVIKQELSKRGINIPYSYGVYSNKETSFVITDGHFVVSDDSPHIVQAGFKNLFNSEYRADLFTNDVPSPGLLMIHFPTRASVVWSSVWKTLLASIIFTGIMLFCFAYAIQTIFRQKKISEMKTDFINNMTHEFKTPIATISLAADSITSPMILGNSNKVERFAEIIKQENKRMNSQVEKVLQMAQIDKREFGLKLTEINLHDVIRQAVQNAALQVEKKQGKVSVDLQASPSTIEGDLTHISNVINNLLENANKYSPNNPDISVHTRNVPNGVQVIVKDKGIGMSKEARKHIFDKFYRVHTGDLHDVKGFGLGLSYVKAMMTAHKGQIDVKSELGKGSSFILVFPTHQSN